MACLDDNAINAYLEARLPADELARAVEHLSTCEACLEIVCAARPASPPVSPHDATTPADGNFMPAGALARGEKVGRYEIVRVVGRGGMGVVYAAYDPQLDRQVALKVLHSARTASLIAEAKALARLDDPHVVQVFDAGEHDGGVFIAMQLVIGDDLRTVLAQRRPPPAEIIRWFVDAGRGLVAAHAAGLVHRDFKPGNVLLDRRGRIAVTDFGLAVDTLGAAEASRTFAGTPLYMAPEQHALEPATAASDQFAFCAAMWEALFGQHPFVAAEDFGSPALIGHHICEAPLIAPARTVGVPRAIVDALERGLAKRPTERWPSMAELIAQLAPHKPRRIWPVVVAALGSALLAGGGIWLFGGRAHVTSCDASAEQALARVWSPSREAVQRAAFARSQRPYAAAAAARTSATLAAYATRWRGLSVGTCTAETTAEGSELLVKKRACLDAALDRWRALDGVLETGTTDVVDHVDDVLATLPDLGDCSDPKTIMASPDVPSLALAPAVIALRAELDQVGAEQATGSTRTLAAARSLVARAESLGWAPGIARAHIALGNALALAYLPALDELAHGAELAIASHLDSEAIRAWTRAVGEAAYEQKPDLLAMLISEARSTAQRLGNPAAALDLEVAYQRALVQIQRGDDALAICKAAIATAQKLGNASVENDARDCVFEALVPTGNLEELHRVAAERVAFETARFGPEAPPIATYEEILADTDATAGNLGAARAEVDRALAVIYKAFPTGKNPKVAEILQTRAAVEAGEGKPKAAVATLRAARDIAIAFPRAAVTLATIDTMLSQLVARPDDTTAARRYLEEAIAAVRAQAPKSVALAMLLINYGQVLAQTDLPAALRTLQEARDLFEALHDPRASYASAALAAIEVEAHRWPEARVHAEEAVAFAAKDPAAVPANTAEMQFDLAQALVETHGDKHRAVALARSARATLASLGPAAAPLRGHVDAWLAKHR